MTDLPGADDDHLESTEERLQHEVAGDDALGAPTETDGTGDSAVSPAEGQALAPPD